MKLAYIKELINRYQLYIKISVSISILIVIFNIIDLTELVSVLFKIKVSTLTIIVSITVLSFINQALTWFFCLKISEDQKENMISIVKSHTIGIALRLFLPGGTGTFGKVFYVKQGNKRAAFYSIVVEKFFIIWSVWFFALWSVVILVPNGKVLFIILAILLSFLVIIIPRLLKRYITPSLYNKFFLLLPYLITTSLITRLFDFIQYYLLLKCVTEIDLSFINSSICVAIVCVANTIPITINGLGLRETIAALIFPSLGIPIEISIGVPLVIFFLNAIIPAIPGAVLIITSKRKKERN